MRETPRGRGPGTVLAVFVAVCLCSFGWPLFPLAAGTFPVRVMGLPFALVWSVAWMLATFAVVAGYHFRSGGEELASVDSPRERDEERA